MTVTKERWCDLCRQAAVERDPEKLAILNEEINSILHRANQPSGSSDQSSQGEEQIRARGQSA